MPSKLDNPVLLVCSIHHAYPNARDQGLGYRRTGKNFKISPAPAIQSVSFRVSRGEICSIVGKSGCGKSTLLRIIAGLLRPTSGTVQLDGQPVLHPSRNLSVVFQDYSKSLLPWKTVEGNLRLGLLSLQLNKDEEARRVRSYLELVGLYASANKFPWQLSGGMQQRVAIARALAREPKLLLLDEPFGALDSPTRFELEDEVMRMAQLLGITVLMITHDIDEAVYMSDRVLVMAQNGIIDALSEDNISSGVICVTLGKDRNQIETRADHRFSEYRSCIMREMHLMSDKGLAHL